MRRFKRYLRFCHRWVGLLISLLLMHLAITGWLLNHSEDWQWSKRFVRSTWLMHAYGIAEPNADVAIALHQDLLKHPSLKQHWITQWQQKIFVDEHLLLADFQGQLVAVLALPDFYLLATKDSLLAVNAQGSRVWQLDGLDQLPAPLTGLLVQDRQVILQTPEQNWLFDVKKLTWEPSAQFAAHASIAETTFNVPVPQLLPMNLQAAISPQVNQQQISWQQILLDLHSGRLINAVVLMDITAWLLLVLSISGLLLFFRRRP